VELAGLSETPAGVSVEVEGGGASQQKSRGLGVRPSWITKTTAPYAKDPAAGPGAGQFDTDLLHRGEHGDRGVGGGT
jgi:hypothetical protein